MDEIIKLQQRMAHQEQQIKNLQESVGRWKRKAQETAPRFEYVSERHERGHHFISIPVEGLPSDVPLHEAQEYIRAHVLPKFYPYKYHNCYSSRRYGGWVVTLIKEDRTIDMDQVPASEELI
jgi:hypothetical protein